jgi:hypothetical protein
MNYDSLPCPAKGCRGCKGPKCRNDNKHDDDEASKTGIQTAQKSKVSTQESTSPPAKTTGGILSPSNAVMSSKWPTVSTLVSRSASASSQSLASSSLSSFLVRPTRSCQALAALDEADLITNNETLKRDNFVDVRPHHVEKRGEKSGEACGVDLVSFSFPSSGQWPKGKKPKEYGFNIRDSCDNYDSDKPEPAVPGVWGYQTEHVLEWQIVTTFFNQINGEYKKDFVHPDPDRKGDKVDFCEYWKESWAFDLAHDQVMDDPRPKAVVTPTPTPINVLISSTRPRSRARPSKTPVSKPIPKVRKGTPFGWLASQYPHKGRNGAEWVEEFALLEQRLNGEYKAKVSYLKTHSSQ